MSEDDDDDIQRTLDSVMDEHSEVIKKLVANKPELRGLLREILVATYIRGLFTGIMHAENDEESEEDDHDSH